jgi:hypothetical protein
MNTTVSDICLWAEDGVSWQIKEISSSRLQADEQKIAKDFVQTQADIDLIH